MGNNTFEKQKYKGSDEKNIINIETQYLLFCYCNKLLDIYKRELGQFFVSVMDQPTCDSYDGVRTVVQIP